MTVVVFNTTPGSITVGGGGANDPPSGVTSIQIECWGAGGSSAVSASAEAGGSSGAYSLLNSLTVTDGTVVHWSLAATGQSSGGLKPSPTSVWTTDVTSPVCAAESGSSGGGEGLSVNGVGDVKFSGARGVAAQGGGGSRGGGGGSSSAGPGGAGVAGSPGSGASGGAGAAGSGIDVGGGGQGAAGATNNLLGGNGSTPGGGAGGGGSGTNSNGGTGGAGQVRFTWTAAASDTLLGQACL